MPSQKDIRALGKDEATDPARSSSARSSGGTKKRATKKDDDSLHGRLVSCFDRISDSFKARGDNELGALFEEDAEIMANGLVSLTRPFKAVRTFVTLFVAIVEPALSFGRLVRVLARRFYEWRWQRAQEHEPTDSNASDTSHVG